MKIAHARYPFPNLTRVYPNTPKCPRCATYTFACTCTRKGPTSA